MGFTFRKSLRLFKGVRLNIGKRGISSITLGGNGLGYRIPIGSSNQTRGEVSSSSGCLGCLGTCVLGGLAATIGFAFFGSRLVSSPDVTPLVGTQASTPVPPTPTASSPALPPTSPTTITPAEKPAPNPISEKEVSEIVLKKTLSTPDLNESSRTWSDATKKFQTDALMVATNDGSVTLRRTDNSKEVKLPISKLSEVDQIYIMQVIAPRVDPKAKVIIGRITEVMDGDTIRIANALETVKTVRLVGVDAPEKTQPQGKEVLERLASLIVNKQGRVEYTATDRYERILGSLYLDDVWINANMVATGDAWHYEQFFRNLDFEKLQYHARYNKLGLWQDKEAIAPWEWRDGIRQIAIEEPVSPQDSVMVYITKLGKHYHDVGCRHLRKDKIPIQLNKARSAYQPCKICNPVR